MTTSEHNRQCPWVGPVPCEEWHAARFFGRAKEIREIFPKIKTQNLTVISSDSGAGKTSLINAGLVPALRLSRARNPHGIIGFTLCVRDWGVATQKPGASSKSISAAQVMTDAIKYSLEKLVKDTKEHANSLFGVDVLNSDLVEISKISQSSTNGLTGEMSEIGNMKKYLEQLRDSVENGKLIIIVDQAEEFMGSGIQVGSKYRHIGALDVLEAISQMNHVRLVISLREEYLGKLRPLEGRLYPLAPRVYHLNPFNWKGARETLHQLTKKDTEVEIDDEVINRLFFILSFPEVEDPSQHDLLPIDMLSVQALLYDLYKRGSSSSTPSGRLKIDIDYINKYISDLKEEEPQLIEKSQDGTDAEKKEKVIHSLLLVGPMLRWIDSAFDKVDPEKQNLVKRVVANMGTVLSTPSGFKSHISRGDLIYHAIKKDLPMNENNPKNVHNELMRNPEGLINSNFKAETVELATAGGKAIDCLVYRSILKSYGKDKHGSTIYSLQHDGYAPALTEWCEDPRRRENDCLTPRIGVYGVLIQRKKTLENVNLDEVRWEGCAVHNITVTNVIFTKCKFTGSFFKGCTFTDCTFDDCELDGAVILGCKFFGVKFLHCRARGLVAKSLLDDKTKEIKLEMLWQKVQFKDCNLSSSVFENIFLEESLRFEDCIALYAQLYKFGISNAAIGEVAKITVKGCYLHGSFFSDFAKVYSEKCFVLSDITKAPSLLDQIGLMSKNQYSHS